MKNARLFDAPVPIAERVKSAAAKINGLFLPNLSERVPAEIAPTKQPIKALLINQPCKEGNSLIPKKSHKTF